MILHGAKPEPFAEVIDMKEYEKPKMEIIEIASDVIVTSCTGTVTPEFCLGIDD